MIIIGGWGVDEMPMVERLLLREHAGETPDVAGPLAGFVRALKADTFRYIAASMLEWLAQLAGDAGRISSCNRIAAGLIRWWFLNIFR